MLNSDTVLVVHGATSVRRHLVNAIKTQFGCQEVIELASGEDATSVVLSGKKIDWVFYDWDCHNQSDKDFLDELRQSEYAESISLTLMIDPDCDGTCMPHSTVGLNTEFLRKPFSISEFVSKVKGVYITKVSKASGRHTISGENRVTAHLESGYTVELTLIDVSNSGCQLKVERPEKRILAVYDSARLEISCPESILEVDAELMRIENDKDRNNGKKFVKVAFRFTSISDGDKKILNRFVESLEEEESLDELVE